MVLATAALLGVVSLGVILRSAPLAHAASGKSRIVFDSNRDGDDEIFTMRSDGSRQRHLTRNDGVNDIEPALSPSGKRIAFGRVTQAGNEDIWVMDADGSHKHRVTYDPRSEEYPDWAKLR